MGGERMDGPANRPGRDAEAKSILTHQDEQIAFQARLLAAVGQPLAACDALGCVNYWNPASEEITGWPAAQVMGRNILEILPDAGPPGEGERILCALLKGEAWKGEFEFLNRAGNPVPVFVTATPVRGIDGVFAGFICSAHDIRDRRALIDSERFFRALFETAADAIFVADPTTGRILDANPAAETMIGRSREEILRMNQADLHPPEPAAEMRRKFEDACANPGPCQRTIHVLHRDGRAIPVEINSGGTIEVNGRPIHFGIFRDVSERHKTESQIRAALAEKEVLLREVHHRVKNNLQTVLSLAQLQARHITDPAALRGVVDLQERIRAIAVAHESLYQSGGLSSLRARPYLERLAANLFQIMGASGIRFRAEIEDLRLPVDKAVPLGLVATELINNALRHAFDRNLGGSPAPSSQRPKEIFFTLKLNSGQCELTVADTGSGLPPDFDWRNARSLGLLLVNRLAAQLRGRIEAQNTPGASFTLFFPGQGIGDGHE